MITLSAKKVNERTECFSCDVCSADFKIRAYEVCYSEFSDVTAYSQSKHAVVGTSGYIETVYHDVGIFMQLTQCCVFIPPLDDVWTLINNLLF